MPPNSTKRYGDSGKLVPENAFSAAIVVASSSSQRVTGTPDADDRRRRAARRLDRRERGARDDDVLGDRMQPQRQLGDHAERPLRADEEIRQVVAGRRLHGARAGADDAPVREHDLELEHVRAHAAVAHGRRAARVRRRHPAERRVGAGVDREPEPVRAGRRLELRARHARLDGRGQVVGPQRDDRVHARQVEADPAVERDHVALEARARAERHDGHAGAVRVREHGRDLGGRLREDDDVRAVRRVIREIGRVLVEHRLAVVHAALVGDQPEQVAPQVRRHRHGASLSSARRRPEPRRHAAPRFRHGLAHGVRGVLVHAGSVADEDVRRLDREQPARRREPQERRDREPLAPRAVVRRGAERVGAHERAEVREPERHLVPALPLQHGDHLERRACRREVRDDVMRHAESAGDACAVAAVPIEQLHDGCGLTERANALERLVVVDRIDQPDPAARGERVRGSAA